MKKRLLYWALSLLLIAATIAWLIHWSQRDRLIYQEIYLAPGADKPVIAKTYEFGGEGVGFVPEGACRSEDVYQLPCLPLGYGVFIDYDGRVDCSVKAYISLYKKLEIITDPGRNRTDVKLTGNEEADLVFYAPNKVAYWVTGQDNNNRHGWTYSARLGRMVHFKIVDSKTIDGYDWDKKDSINIYTQYKNGRVMQIKKLTDQEYSSIRVPFDNYAGDPEVNQRAMQWLEDQYIQFEKQLGMSIPRDCNRFVADLKKKGTL